MQRRDFLTLLGGAAAAWPFAASAQQPDRVRRIGVLSALAEDDPESVTRRATFEQTLKALGWTNGSNLRVDYRWSGNDADRIRKLVAELIALAPDLIVTSGNIVLAPMMQATRTIPIVFVQTVDPVGSGFVKSLARPGGNITGFTQFEYSLAAKWVELLKQIAPHVTRAAVIRDPTRGPGIGQFAVVQAIAPSLGMELSPINALDVSEMESAIAEFARSPNGGLIVTVGGTAFHRDLIIALAAKHQLPAVYPYQWRRPDLVWARYNRTVPARRGLRRPHP
jgi:ABC-type uncharacterized transport system substrate-binding protein